MLKIIKSQGQSIIDYLNHGQYKHDIDRTQLKLIAEQINESIGGVQDFFNNLLSSQSLVYYMHQQLMKVRDINHIVQEAKLQEQERISLQQIRAPLPDTLIAVVYQQHQQNSIKTDVDHLQTLLSGVSHMQEHDRSLHISARQLDVPQKQYTIDKIVQLFEFEMNCLQHYKLGGNLLIKRRAIEEDQDIIWILEMINIKKELIRCLQRLHKGCIYLTNTIILEDIFQVEQVYKQHKQQNQTSFNSKQSTGCSLSQSHYENPLLRASKSQLIEQPPASKNCACTIF